MSSKDEIGPAKSGSGRLAGKLASAAGSVARKAVDPRRARGVLGTRLVIGGLAAVCLAGGIDYFQNADAIKRAVTGFARETGHVEFATKVDEVDESLQGAKEEAIDSLPERVREHLALIALVAGLTAMGAGTKLKLGASDERGRVIRDVGRMVVAPGAVGIVAFSALTLESPKLRATFGSFSGKVFNGEMSGKDLRELTAKYAPWAWNEIPEVLGLSLGLIVIAVASRLIPVAEDSPRRPYADFVRRVTFWAGMLLLAYYLAVTALAVASYGGAISHLAWPWKLTPGAFMTSLVFMAFGVALARTGTKMLKRESSS